MNGQKPSRHGRRRASIIALSKTPVPISAPQPRRDLREGFEKFVVLCVPPSISDVHFTMLRGAYYAGALALWDAFRRADATAEDPGKVIARLSAELTEAQA